MAEASRHSDSNKDVGQFEKRLKAVFTPVDPDPGYVQKLRNKLIKKTEIYLEQDNPSFFLLMAILGLIIIILLYFLVAKNTNE